MDIARSSIPIQGFRYPRTSHTSIQYGVKRAFTPESCRDGRARGRRRAGGPQEEEEDAVKAPFRIVLLPSKHQPSVAVSCYLLEASARSIVWHLVTFALHFGGYLLTMYA